MSYTTKYYTQFKDYYDRDILINFDYKDYVGTSEELKSMGNPGDIYQPDNETNIFKPVRGSELKINLLSETNFQLLDLFVTGKRQVKVTVKMDGDTFWLGWLIPNNYNEPYVSAPYPVTVTARDGIGELKTYIWDESDIANPITILAICLNKLELESPVWESVNLYETTYMNNGVADSPFNQCYYSPKNYVGMTYYEVLADVLTGFGAEIQQKDGEWKVTRIRETTGDLIKRRFDIGNSGIGTGTETEDLTKLIGRPQDRNITDYDAEIIVSPGWFSGVIERDFGRKYFFDNSDFQGDYITYSLGQYAKGWLISPSSVFTRDYINQSYMQKCTSFNTLTSFANLIYQSVSGIDAVGLGDFQRPSFRVSIGITKGTLYDADTVLANLKTQISVSDGISTQYLDSDGAWSGSVTYIEFKNVTCNVQKDLTFVEYEVFSEQIPITGDITINIFAPYPVNSSDAVKLESWYLQEVTGDIFNTAFGEYQNNGTLSDLDSLPYYPINSNMTYIPDFDTIFKFGDFPVVDNRQPMYQNGIVHGIFDSTPTSSWLDRDGLLTGTLLQHVQNDYTYVYNQNRWILRGTILSEDLRFDSSIVDYQVNNRKYYCKSGSYNLRSCQLQGIFHEIGAWEGSPWILEDGTWNDNGIWVDSDVWNDSDPTP